MIRRPPRIAPVTTIPATPSPHASPGQPNSIMRVPDVHPLAPERAGEPILRVATPQSNSDREAGTKGPAQYN